MIWFFWSTNFFSFPLFYLLGRSNHCNARRASSEAFMQSTGLFSGRSMSLFPRLPDKSVFVHLPPPLKNKAKMRFNPVTVYKNLIETKFDSGLLLLRDRVKAARFFERYPGLVHPPDRPALRGLRHLYSAESGQKYRLFTNDLRLLNNRNSPRFPRRAMLPIHRIFGRCFRHFCPSDSG